MSYKTELNKAMKILANDKKTILIGQNVEYGGTSMFHTLTDFEIFTADSPDELLRRKRIELPVFEEVQMGISLGMSLEGYIPVSIYPRMDFLLLAINQLVNHLDKCEKMSDGQFKPKVIIRTAIGSIEPLMPGPQHCQDHTEALKKLCTNINIVKLETAQMIVPEYKKALKSDISTILIEIPDKYNKDLTKELKESREK